MATTLSRTLFDPRAVTPLQLVGPLQGIGGSGKINLRSPSQAGWMWTETYEYRTHGPFSAQDQSDARSALARLYGYYRQGEELNMQHLWYQTVLGTGAGTPLVNGADQTGKFVATDGWTGSGNALRAGDLVTFASISSRVYMCIENATISSGAATLTLNPPIFSGGSPGDNDAVTLTDNYEFSVYCMNIQVKETQAGQLASITATYREGFL